MSAERQLWLDTRGVPVITTTLNGERNAIRWGWTAAVAVAYEELAAHTAEAKRQAWDEGVRHAESCPGGMACDPRTANPYKQARERSFAAELGQASVTAMEARERQEGGDRG